MASINPTRTIDPTRMATNWGTGVANNSGKWLQGYLSPNRLFNADPAGSQVAWKAGVDRANASGTYASNLAKADVQKAADNATQYGQTNYANSGTAKAYKFQRKAAALASALTAVKSSVDAMPKGKGANNIARMVAWANGMAAYKGKITAS